jgi:hypothetical protein
LQHKRWRKFHVFVVATTLWLRSDSKLTVRRETELRSSMGFTAMGPKDYRCGS